MKLQLEHITDIAVTGPPFATLVKLDPPTKDEARIQMEILRQYARNLGVVIRSKHTGLYLHGAEERTRIEEGDMDRLRDENAAVLDWIENVVP